MFDADDDAFGSFYDPSSVEFQIYGYGGFGYDTSHVKPDDVQPEIVQAAKNGDLGRLMRVVERARAHPELVAPDAYHGPQRGGRWAKKRARRAAGAATKAGTGGQLTPEALLRCTVHATRRWTEVDYKMSGFTKEWEWHDLTALSAACLAGHDAVVAYLLADCLADPTLEGCPQDDVYYDAARACEAGAKALSENLAVVGHRRPVAKTGGLQQASRTLDPDGHRSPEEAAANALRRLAGFKRCIALVAAVAPFWTRAAYANSRFSPERVSSGFPNLPTDLAALRSAVGAVAPLAGSSFERDSQEVASLAVAIAERRQRLAPQPTNTRQHRRSRR